MLFLKLFLRFIILVLSLNIIEASDRVSDLIYCSLFGSLLYLFRARSLVVSDLRSETKDSWFEPGC